MTTNMRRALLIALLPALTACGHTAGSTSLVKVKVQSHVVTPARVVKLPVPETKPSVLPAPSSTGLVLPTPTALASAAPAAPGTVTVGGYVFNDGGSLVAGVTVYAHSLDPNRPFQGTAVTQSGSYVLAGVPEGANIELIAGATGWTTRRRVSTFMAGADDNRCDFGSISQDTASPGAAYFLSDRPEIQTVQPADTDDHVDPTISSIKLVLSEPLDAINRTRLERAIRLLPANDAANKSLPNSTTDLASLLTAGYPLDQTIDGAMPYDIRKGSVFMQDTSHASACSWSTDGTELTMTLPGPLVSNTDIAPAYQVALVSAGASEAVRDANNNTLGSDANGGSDSYPAAGQLVPATIYNPAATLTAISGISGANWRWAATHEHASRFELQDGEATVALQSVNVATVGSDTRIALAFSAPMAAYDGSLTGFSDASVTGGASALSNFTFALGGTPADLKGVLLNGKLDLGSIDPHTTTSLGDINTVGRTFRFHPNAFVASAVGASAGSITVTVDPQNAHNVVLTIIGKPHFFDAHASLIAARAAGVADPAGHTVEDATAPAAGITDSL